MKSPVKMIGCAELQLIQAALRVDAARDIALKNALNGQLQWEKVLSLARHHGVLPQLYLRLCEMEADKVPPAIMQEMIASQQANELRTFQMTCDLIRIVRTLEAAGIAVLCLKGPALAVTAYGKPSMRHYGDLDILVRIENYLRAKEILLQMGARLTYPERAVNTSESRHDNFLYGDNSIELHWQVTTPEFPDALPVDELFRNCRSISVNGQLLKTLSLEDTVLNLLQHGTQHCWATLRHLAVLTATLQRMEAPELAATFVTAQAQGLLQPMLTGISLSHDLLGYTPPEEVPINLTGDQRTRRAIRLSKYLLVASNTDGPNDFERIHMQIISGHKNRFSTIYAILGTSFVPTATDYQWVKLPAYLRWLYPVLRPVRMIIKGIKILCLRKG